MSGTEHTGKDATTKLDLTKPLDVVVVKPCRIQLKWLQYNAKVFAKMLADFENARPNEAICWTSGRVDEIGLAYVKRYWGCELEYASEVGAKTSPEWLAQFVKRLRNEEPEHNLVLENHSHPIGSQLSGTDRDGLYALYDWSYEIYWVMTACDFQLGIYTVDDHSQVVRRIPWGVEGVWIEHEGLKQRKQEIGNRQSKTKILSTTSNSQWASRIFEKLKERKWFW